MNYHQVLFNFNQNSRKFLEISLIRMLTEANLTLKKTYFSGKCTINFLNYDVTALSYYEIYVSIRRRWKQKNMHFSYF